MALTLRTKGHIFLGVGLLLIALALSFGLALFPAIVRDQIINQVQLTEGTDAYESYMDVKYPITIKFFFFNVTNADDVIQDGAKPKLEQVGPYTYREKRTKTLLSVDQDEDTMTYVQNIQYFYDESLSEGNSEDDKITTVNAVMIGAAQMAEHVGLLNNFPQKITNAGFDVLFNNSEVINTHTVKELTFEGYDVLNNIIDIYESVNVTDTLNNLNNAIEKIIVYLESMPKLPKVQEALEILYKLENLTNIDPSSIALNLSISLPPTISEEGKFAFFNGRNNTDDGTYTVYRGVKDYTKFGQIKTWEGKSSVDFWEGDTCNMINGTDASVSAPFVKKDQRFWIFTTDLCRSLYAVYEKEIEFKGIPGYRFVANEDLMADPSDNGDNWCFCPESGCLRAAVLNVSKCQGDAPVIMSSPHFYLGDGHYETLVDGLKKSKEIHETFMDLEPNSGMLLRIMQRIQINMFTKRYAHLKKFENVTEVLFPIFWVEQYVEMDDASADHYRTLLVTSIMVLEIIAWVLLAIGILLILVSAFLYYKFYNNPTPLFDLTSQKDK